MAFLSTSLCNKPCCYFFGAGARNFSSIQASPHQKEDIWSSCCGCLVYSCPGYSYVISPLFLELSDITILFQHVASASYFSLLLYCIFIIVVSYSSIATKFYCGTHPQHHGAIRRERKLTKTLFIVTIVSLILATPFTIAGLYFTVSPGEIFEISQTIVHLSNFLLCLFHGNSLINPFLYALKLPEFKRALFLLLRCRSRSEPV